MSEDPQYISGEKEWRQVLSSLYIYISFRGKKGQVKNEKPDRQLVSIIQQLWKHMEDSK